MEIKNTTPLKALVKDYPQLELTLARLLPIYGDLQHPHLKETMLAVTTIDHLARKTGREPADLIQTFKRSLGIQDPKESTAGELQFLPSDPPWIRTEPAAVIDGTALLLEGSHPLTLIQTQLEELEPGEFILLKTNFHPQPMIETMEQQGAVIFSREDPSQPESYVTFIQK